MDDLSVYPSFHRVLKVARTLADLAEEAEEAEVREEHVREAVQYCLPEGERV